MIVCQQAFTLRTPVNERNRDLSPIALFADHPPRIVAFDQEARHSHDRRSAIPEYSA